jgi:hypothetical protein
MKAKYEKPQVRDLNLFLFAEGGCANGAEVGGPCVGGGLPEVCAAGGIAGSTCTVGVDATNTFCVSGGSPDISG